MKVFQLDEPELEFASGRHVDIRFGISNYGPFDRGYQKRPSQIVTGVIGTHQTVKECRKWLEKCRDEVRPEQGKAPSTRNPVFPGFSQDSPFEAEIVADESLCGVTRPADFRRIHEFDAHNDRVSKAVDVYLDQIERLKERGAEVIICTLPIELLALLKGLVLTVPEPDATIEGDEVDQAEPEQGGPEREWNFHDSLKARAMRHSTPLQLIRPSTWDSSYLSKEPDRTGLARQLQDEPLRAWNIFCALYYKATGCPWRLPRIEGNIETETCYVGISFYRSLDQTKYRTSLAQVFNERGIRIVVRGGEVETSQEDQQPHLDKTAAAKLLAKALKTYKSDHYHQPPRVVLYKTTRFNENEIAGFASVIESEDISFADFLSVSRSLIRFYRDGYFPPLRGTCLEIDDSRFLVYTKGTVPFYEMYPGPYIPRTLLITKAYGDGTIGGLSQEILALTKMNWNNTQLDGFEPLPVRAAKEVGGILKYCGEKDSISSYYRNYM